MPSYGNRIAALKELSGHLEGVEKVAKSTASSVRDSMGSIRESFSGARSEAEETRQALTKSVRETESDVNPRLQDLKNDLAHAAEQGNKMSEALLDMIRQVEQGTLRAEDILHKFGAANTAFEGQLRNVDDLLLEFLPTSGQVIDRINEMARELDGADVPTLIDRLKGQYNEYALVLTKTVEAFARGEASLERVLAIAQQIKERLPGSETDVLAQEILDAIDSGLLGGLL